MSDGGGLALPAAPRPLPGFPSNFQPLPFEGYETLNVKSPRPAIKDSELAWCDGWMPLAPNNLQVLPDIGPIKYTAVGGATVVWHGFGNIGDQQYGYALLSTGQLDAFDPSTGSVVATIWQAGTILSPTSIFGLSQWGSQFALFCKDQTNGYWVWDGTNLFTAGTVDPLPTIENAGQNYTSAPTVSFYTTGNGTPPNLSIEILNGSVVQVNFTNPGSGFGEYDQISATISGGGSDNQAAARPIIGAGGGVNEVIITNPGSGYTPYAAVQFRSVDGNGGGAVGYPVIEGGAITSIALQSTGSGYTQPPQVTVSDPGYGSGSSHIDGGSGFDGSAVLSYGQIIELILMDGGSNYTTPPTVTALGDGTGFVAVAQVENGQVVGFIIQNYGFGYSQAVIVLEGGNNAANLRFAVFPYGISGTAIETNQSRAWIGNGAATADFPPKSRVIYSDPDTPTGFGNGGGAFESQDSFLRIGYHWLRQTNGFLYLGGDSSTNYISGVSTSAPTSGVPITTFSNQNVDPQIGSPWPASVQVLSRNIVLANPQGIFVSYGGAMTKISTPIDPLYQTCPTLASATANFSAAVADIFNVQVYMLLIEVFDPILEQLINKLIMWDGKRLFTSQQGVNLTFISTQEVNSVLTAWGTDGTNIFPLFQAPSTNFTKTVQSKLYGGPGYFITKTLTTLQGIFQANTVDSPLVIEMDNETGQNSFEISVSPTGGISWTGADGDPLTWTGADGDPLTWGGTGLNIFGPIPVGQNGRLLGYTVTTTASDIALLSILGRAQDFSTNI